MSNTVNESVPNVNLIGQQVHGRCAIETLTGVPQRG